MSGPQVFYSGRRHGNASGESNEDCPQITKRTVNDSFLRLASSLEEAEIHVSTSRNYIKAAKNSINKLMNYLANADADLNTAEECILESDVRLRSLRAELQSLFNRTFYLNLDADSDGTTASNERQANAAFAADEFSVPDHVSQALEKYAQEANINLEKYEISFDRCHGLMFIVMQSKGVKSATFQQRSETSDGELTFKFMEGVSNQHFPVDQSITFSKESSQGQNTREITNKTKLFPITSVKSPRKPCLGSHINRRFLQFRNHLPREEYTWTSADELHQSNVRHSPKLVNNYEHQSEGILVNIDSSDSENECATSTEENKILYKCKERRPSASSEIEDLIKLFSNSDDSGTIKLSVEEIDKEDSSNVNPKVDRTANNGSSEPDLPHSSHAFQRDNYSTSFTTSNRPKSTAEHFSKKTYSLSSISKDSRHTSDQKHFSVCHNSTHPMAQNYDTRDEAAGWIPGVWYTSCVKSIDREEKIANKKIKNRFDQMEVASPKGLGARCFSDLLYNQKAVASPDMKCFRTPQYKNRRHTLTSETLSETFHLSDNQKQSQNPLCFAKTAAKNSVSGDETAPTRSAGRDIFDSLHNRSRSKEISKSPSYISSSDEVFRYKQESELSDFDTVSVSTAIDMCFVSEAETSSYIDDVSTSNAVDMSFDSPTEHDFSANTYDESLSSLNANTSESVYVLISEASSNSRSPTPDKEILSPFNDLPHSSQRVRKFDFEKYESLTPHSSQRVRKFDFEKYESLTPRDSAESFLTVYEPSADIGRFQSDKFSIPEQHNSTFSSSITDSNPKPSIPWYFENLSESEHSP